MISANERDLDLVESVYRELPACLDSRDPVVTAMRKYVLSHRGKGLRPVFMALAADLSGDGRDRIREAAVIIEAIHIASLIHDDVIDGSGMRRGAETLQVRTSSKTAVLFGDFVFIKALSGIHRIPHPDAAEVIFRAVGHMVEGEIRESVANMIGEPEYLEIIGKKTGSLFAAAGELGVMLSGCGAEMRKWGRELGKAAGLTYQIIDDLLDLIGDSSKTGKPGYMDLKRGYMTLPLIHALREAGPEAAHCRRNGDDGSPEQTAAFIRQNGGLAYTFEKANEYRRKAREMACKFGNPDAASALDGFLNSLTAGVDRSCLI